MITPHHLVERLSELLDNVVPIDVIRFEQDDFKTPEAEDAIEVHRAPSARIRDPLQFWVSSVVAQDWTGREEYLRRYLQGSLCRPLSEVQFNQIISDHSGTLLRPLPQPLHPAGGFLSAFQMDDDWNQISVVAIYDDELIAFYWCTTA